MTVKTDISFRITGPCLSLIISDCERSDSDEVGFLIGDKSSLRTQSVSDEMMEEEKIETTITISGALPVGLPFVFCEPLGRINKIHLKEILGNCGKDIVGWYSYRRESSHRPTLRERFIHKEISEILDKPQFFLFCMITTTNDKGATHSLKLSFSSTLNKRMQPVSVLETNFGELEENLYKKNTINWESFKHLKEIFSSLNRVDNSKMVMGKLKTEVNKQMSILEKSVMSLQDGVDTNLKQQNNSSFSNSHDQEPEECSSVEQTTFNNNEINNELQENADMKPGEWVAVIFDNTWYPGLIEQKIGDMLHVSFMQRAGPCSFSWPPKKDIQVIMQNAILSKVAPPHPISSRHFGIADHDQISDMMSN